MAYLRIVRFEDVNEERLAGLRQRLDEGTGPPEGVKATGVQFNHDADQNTMVVIQKFDSMEDMKASEEAFESMDPERTPGTRVSVDRCETIGELGA
jgi:hypothetical protein